MADYGLKPDTTPPGWKPNDTPPGSPPNQYTVARANNVGSTLGLLQHKDGCCGAWASFLLDIAKAQGIKSDKISSARILVNKPYDGLAVNVGLGTHHNQIPLERSWSDHWIIVYDNNFYDTSYGVAYGDWLAFYDTFISNLEAVLVGNSWTINNYDPNNPNLPRNIPRSFVSTTPYP